jgi:hypothetical protein
MEIRLSFDAIHSLVPCNFLGHTLMWASLSPCDNTSFLEEDPKWVQTIL